MLNKITYVLRGFVDRLPIKYMYRPVLTFTFYRTTIHRKGNSCRVRSQNAGVAAECLSRWLNTIICTTKRLTMKICTSDFQNFEKKTGFLVNDSSSVCLTTFPQ